MSIVSDVKLVSKCGLYCGACKAYLKEKCKGCSGNLKATWCKVRSCCLNNDFDSCADCLSHKDYSNCGKLNNFISKVFSFLFKSDRIAGINMIKENGSKYFADRMASSGMHSVKKEK